MGNADIRSMIKKSGIPQYEVAKRCGVNEGTLCRWLRYDLPEDDKRRSLIINALNERRPE